MPKQLDLIGQRFGRLVVTDKIGSVTRSNGSKVVQWQCRCDCGQSTTSDSSRLRTGNTRSCGCLVKDQIAAVGRDHQWSTRTRDLTGQIFGFLTALAPTTKRAGSSIIWACRCECGKAVLASSARLTTGQHRSCGCRRGDGLVQHGATIRKRWTPEYVVWSGIIARCTNPKSHAYPRYGGAGIGICARWRRFANFYNDMGRRPKGTTIDRKDNARGYEPDNCRWATQTEQNRNRSDNHLITVGTETLCIAEWAERSGIPAKRIASRIQRGWDPTRAITTPIQHSPSKTQS